VAGTGTESVARALRSSKAARDPNKDIDKNIEGAIKMARKIRDSVVVITGASSGIGRATAQAFAREGATVVLAARRKEALEEVAAECGNGGGTAVVVPTDVTDEGAVEDLARRAMEEGRIDTWVNNAAVTLFARFEEAPPEVYRQVFNTNFFGVIHGARAVLPYFREQGEGVLINMSSVVSSAPQPYTSAYVASKYAIRGFSECLRMELALDEADDIHVVHMMPASIDTPLFQNAANYTGRAVKPLDPVISPHRVADAAVKMARSPRPEVKVGVSGRMMVASHSAMPRMYERIASRQVDSDHFREVPTAPSSGNLFEPPADSGSVDGGWADGDDGGRPLGKGIAATAAVAAIPLAIWGWKRHQGRS